MQEVPAGYIKSKKTYINLYKFKSKELVFMI